MGTWLYKGSPVMHSIEPIMPDMPNNRKAKVVKMVIDILSQRSNDLKLDVAERFNTEARFNAPPHQSELN